MAGVRKLMLIPALALALVGCAPTDAAKEYETSRASQPPATTAPGTSAAAATPDSRAAQCAYPVGGNPAKPADPPSTTDVANKGTASAVISLNGTEIQVSLDQAAAPCTVHSFLSLASQGYYDNTKCHRLVDQGIFILQCGDPSGTGRGGPGYSFADELTGKETYPAGTIAMANAGPNTNGSQFFFVYADTPLPPEYTVFGHMDAKGVETVGEIASQGVDAGDRQTPIAPADITSITVG